MLSGTRVQNAGTAECDTPARIAAGREDACTGGTSGIAMIAAGKRFASTESNAAHAGCVVALAFAIMAR
jgi:hypothetical protein